MSAGMKLRHPSTKNKDQFNSRCIHNYTYVTASMTLNSETQAPSTPFVGPRALPSSSPSPSANCTQWVVSHGVTDYLRSIGSLMWFNIAILL